MFRNIKSKVAAVGALLLGAVGAANAAVDTTAITAASTDVSSVGTAVFAVIVGVYAFKWIRRTL